MSTLQCGSKKIHLDEEGFLAQSEEWDEGVANVLAKNEGIEQLDDAKMDIVKFLREYHQKHSSFPILSYVCKHVNNKRKDCVTKEFVDPMKAWKIAGLPKPDNVFFVSFDGKKYAANPFY